MSKQSELVGLARTTNLDEVNAAYSAGALSNRNLIINGAMQVGQRGTSGGVTTSYTYMLDRWLANGGITSWAQTGAQKSVLQVVTQAGTGPAQRIESNGANFVSGNTYTLSFQVNPTIADVTVGVTFRNGNSYLSEIVAVTDVSSQVVAGSYSTVTYTFTLSSSADIVTYPSHNMQVFIGSSVVNTLNITGVQLEVGDTATPFEHRSYGQELALCQRYFETGDVMISGVKSNTSTGCLEYESFKVSKRSQPTMTKLNMGSLLSVTDVQFFNVNYSPLEAFGHTTSTGASGQHIRYAIEWAADAEL